ncbi:hypothetical protein B0H11DRAFT_160959 [Mycena galericulata]|nr:hypothetical protein B0H11DRAFT_160959 [Mycena galericulata]
MSGYQTPSDSSHASRVLAAALRTPMPRAPLKTWSSRLVNSTKSLTFSVLKIYQVLAQVGETWPIMYEQQAPCEVTQLFFVPASRQSNHIARDSLQIWALARASERPTQVVFSTQTVPSAGSKRLAGILIVGLVAHANSLTVYTDRSHPRHRPHRTAHAAN